MDALLNLPFNRKPSTIMHIDLNSCFASVEQQANPLLRNRPVAVAAYTTPSGCIVAPSIEAKRLGIKTGMRVKEGMLLCPELVVLPPDPHKYRAVHLELKRVLARYTDQVGAKSIDEFVIDLAGSPAQRRGMHTIAEEIKARIRQEIGEWLSVSIGIAPNRFLAKLAAGLHKPDGLDGINHTNYIATYCDLELTDLCGINRGYAIRLHNAGIFNVIDFYEAAPWELKAAFQSIVGHYWYYRLRGWEIDDVEFRCKSFGHSYSLPEPLTSRDELAPILNKLVEKMGARLRRAGYRTQGVHVCVAYRDHDYWHQSVKLARTIFDSRDIYREAYNLLCRAPRRKPVRNLAVSCFNLSKRDAVQLELFDDARKKERLVDAVDSINERYGAFVITPARMLGMENRVIDRISFGSIKELEALVCT
jgi:DNA polymerase-4